MTVNRRRTTRILIGGALAGAMAVCWAAPAVAVEKKADTPAWHVRKANWQETLRASREALVRAEADAAGQAERQFRADPVLSRFKPASIVVRSADKARRVRVRVTGLKKLILRAEEANEQNKRRGGHVHLADARVLAADGEAVFLFDREARLIDRHGRRRHVGNERRKDIVGGRECERAVSLAYDRDGAAEGVFELGGRYEWFEAHVGFREDRRKREEAARITVDCRSLLAAADQAVVDRQALERLVRDGFCDQQSADEQRVERDARIWQEPWPAGDFAELAARYARSCAEPYRKAADRRAKSARSADDLEAVRGLFYMRYTAERLELARKTLEFVQQGAPRPKLAAELTEFEKRLEQFAGKPGPGGRRLYTEIRRLRRKIILTHPLLAFDKLLINKRPPPGYSHMCDQYLGRHSRPGPGLVVLDNWKDKPTETALLAGKLPEGSVLHPDLSYDGKRVAFSYCDHTEKQPSRRRFFLWEIGIDGKGLRQLTGTRSDPLVGWGGRHTVLIEDFDACYLPDGGLAFVSTRNQTYGRCHGGRYTPVYMLFRCDGDGSNVRQISFGEANEWDPSVLPDGRIIYTRWDYINRHDTRFQSLWTTYPDGRATAHYYGNYSHSPCMTAEARAVPGSHQVVCTATAHHGYTTGSTLLVDPFKGRDDWDPLTKITTEFAYPEARDSGRFTPGASATPWPISEDLFLVAYMTEPRVGQGRVQSVNAYSIYLVDTLGGREMIWRDPEMSCFAPIPIRARPAPPVLPNHTGRLADSPCGVFFVKDVHKSTQPLEPGAIKHLRINEIIGQPTSSHPSRSRAANEIVKRILGTVPVEADGSVAFRAPAGVPMQLQALDANGMALMTMRSLVYLQPGELAGCVGCHESRMTTGVIGRAGDGAKVHDIEPPAGPRYERGFSFARTVQPVLDRYCIRCHGLNENRVGGKINLLGTRAGGFSIAYNSLTERRDLVKIAHRNSETNYSKPKDYFAHGGKLVAFLTGRHRMRVKLDRDGLERIINWLDLNAQFYGDYSRNRAEDRRIDPAAEKAFRQRVHSDFGPDLAAQPIAALVNVAMPAESRILNAPLAVSAGGWGQIKEGGWRDRSDAGYRRMRQLVEAVIVPHGSKDTEGTCGRQRGCRCGSCWVRKAEQDYKDKIAAGK